MTNQTLVTGGSGYFGSLLVNQLRSEGFPVRVFDLVDNDESQVDVEFNQGDIRNYDLLSVACQNVDVIYHCVAQVPLAKDKQLFQDVNVRGTNNLLRAALSTDVTKIILLSSSAVYGIPEKNPVDNMVQPKPVEDYGRTKLEGEQIAYHYHIEHGLDITIIRPRTILGHGRLGIFEILFNWVADGRDVYVLGSGDNTYQFVHADDLARACIAAAERPGYTVYNIGTDHYCSMRASLEGLIDHANTGSQVRSLPMQPAIMLMKLLSRFRLIPLVPYHWLMYGRELYFDLSRSKRELRWQPKWGNIEMLCQSYDWYVHHRAELGLTGGQSAHRNPVSQGLLQLLKWLS